jgi:hypothetical protein
LVSHQGDRILRGGALPPALLCAAVGLSIAFGPPRARVVSAVALVAVATMVPRLLPPNISTEIIFLGCWASVVASAAAVHLPNGLTGLGALAVAVNAGFWSGAVVVVAGSESDLLRALPAALAIAPAVWLIRSRAAIVVKVVSSWLIAVALLAATLQLLPVTPGYIPDHLE